MCWTKFTPLAVFPFCTPHMFVFFASFSVYVVCSSRFSVVLHSGGSAQVCAGWDGAVLLKEHEVVPSLFWHLHWAELCFLQKVLVCINASQGKCGLRNWKMLPVGIDLAAATNVHSDMLNSSLFMAGFWRECDVCVVPDLHSGHKEVFFFLGGCCLNTAQHQDYLLLTTVALLVVSKLSPVTYLIHARFELSRDSLPSADSERSCSYVFWGKPLLLFRGMVACGFPLPLRTGNTGGEACVYPIQPS